MWSSLGWPFNVPSSIRASSCSSDKLESDSFLLLLSRVNASKPFSRRALVILASPAHNSNERMLVSISAWLSTLKGQLMSIASLQVPPPGPLAASDASSGDEADLRSSSRLARRRAAFSTLVSARFRSLSRPNASACSSSSSRRCSKNIGPPRSPGGSVKSFIIMFIPLISISSCDVRICPCSCLAVISSGLSYPSAMPLQKSTIDDRSTKLNALKFLQVKLLLLHP
mmetsp:Transcript_13436/g.29181  ORF Transcript_13436/g.29181 Transcript_13436/m.29181 type:complete len:227 (+) Transcript_13436:659-1339(+)